MWSKSWYKLRRTKCAPHFGMSSRQPLSFIWFSEFDFWKLHATYRGDTKGISDKLISNFGYWCLSNAEVWKEVRLFIISFFFLLLRLLRLFFYTETPLHFMWAKLTSLFDSDLVMNNVVISVFNKKNKENLHWILKST